jgi:trimeric autotransporter adhesin
MKVSRQVTGIRKDPWANAHRIRVEEDKPDKERGYYIHPDLYGQAPEKRISRLRSPADKGIGRMRSIKT